MTKLFEFNAYLASWLGIAAIIAFLQAHEMYMFLFIVGAIINIIAEIDSQKRKFY